MPKTLRAALRHPFLSLWAFFFVGVVVVMMWQWSPGCRSWRGKVSRAASESWEDNLYDVDQPQPHEENPELTPDEIRRQLSERAAMELADERPLGCL